MSGKRILGCRMKAPEPIFYGDIRYSICGKCGETSFVTVPPASNPDRNWTITCRNPKCKQSKAKYVINLDSIKIAVNSALA